ncbi:MAG: Franean1_4349 family RiPP [Alphaproteobacteria bacterium]|nr:Franean1_4349 family RiPP [Alphaproteobacteria bacterium]
MDVVKPKPIAATKPSAEAPSLGKAELLGRALSDPAFRARLFADPEATVRTEGYIIDAETMSQLMSLDPDAAEKAAQALGDEFTDREAAC